MVGCEEALDWVLVLVGVGERGGLLRVVAGRYLSDDDGVFRKGVLYSHDDDDMIKVCHKSTDSKKTLEFSSMFATDFPPWLR